MKRIIYAMSKAKSDLAAWIEDHTFPTMCAIAQLYLFPEYSAKSHWRQEVWSKFGQMHILRTTKDLPSSKFIFENSWGVDKRFVEDAVDWATGHEENLTPREDIDLEYLYSLMEAYFEWASTKLSVSRALKPKDVYAKLEELGL